MASTATQKGNRGQLMARDVLQGWTHKKMKSSSQSGMPGYNHDPHKGDILCNTEGHFFPFTVEVKFYKEINFCHLLQPNIKLPLIIEFWAQCFGDAKICKKIPMLMMRFNGLPKDFFFVVIEHKFMNHIYGLFTPSISCLEYHSPEESLVLLRSDQFFSLDYKEIKRIAKTQIKALY